VRRIEREADSSVSRALRARRRRHAFFLGLLQGVPRPTSILDVGGTPGFWIQMGFSGQVDMPLTVLNLDPAESADPCIRTVTGDARCMDGFEDGQFDVVFSNSVIEHVGGFVDQQRMAREIQRVGRRYFVQTPNRYFPIEPHFGVPFFQFLPLGVRAWLIHHFKLGAFNRNPDPQVARQRAASVNLLSRRRLSRLFEGAAIYEERIFGLNKSFIAYAGWDAEAS
jgi:hypothetical protein